MMESRFCTKDIIRCFLCRKNFVESHCELCHIYLCNACEGEHLSFSNTEHRDIDERKTKSIASLNEHEEEIKEIASDINQNIVDMKKSLQSSDISSVFAYKSSRIKKITSLPTAVNVPLPVFSPCTINTEQLNQMFGSLSASKEEHGYKVKSPEPESCASTKLLLDKPKLITTIDTGYKEVYSVSCRNDEKIWICGDRHNMKLFNQRGKLLNSVKPGSFRKPYDVTVTRRGYLVYTDQETRTVNIVKDLSILEDELKKIKKQTPVKSQRRPHRWKYDRYEEREEELEKGRYRSDEQKEEIIKLQMMWKPYYVCSAYPDDLLVTMKSENKAALFHGCTEKQSMQTKVVRYSGCTEKQSIQFDDNGKPLYSSGDILYVSENWNQDICVADCEAREVVVVNHAGKLRFRYTGHPSPTKRSFIPFGITTDSKSHILTADLYNNCVHILDQDGKFLRYIDNCDLRAPWGLCVDDKNNIFVAENLKGRVKKIKYM